ncbi:hypothetical protein Hanom_Chr13g01190401 [Helianthus anomalus]
MSLKTGDHKDVSKKDDIIVDVASEPTKKMSQERNVMTTKEGVLSLYLYGYFDCGIYFFC